MHGLIREEYTFGANPGTKDLARHLFTRMSCGKVVIIADNPAALMGPLRKQWLKLARKVQKERASTLNAERIFELSEMVQRMQTLRFTTTWPDDYSADVYVATMKQLLRWAPECRTLYVTCALAAEELHIVSALMNRGGVVIVCPMAGGKK